MARWSGGFTGEGFDRAGFKQWLKTQKKPRYHRIVIHNTAAPYIIPPVTPQARMRNLGNYYRRDLGWSGGPDFFVIGDKIYLGSPLGKSIGSRGWNGNSFHLECEGDYDGTHDPKKEPGLTAWRAMAWATAELLEWMGWQANNETIKFHKEGNTTHDCPGKLVTKPWFLSLVTGKEPELPAPPKDKGDTYWVNTPGDNLNFRADPNGRIRSVLPHGLSVMIDDRSGDWARVKTPAGYYGWVYTKYLSKVDVNDPDNSVPDPQLEGSIETKWVNTPGDRLNFREEPNGRKKSVLPHGLMVSVVDTKGNWSRVKTPAGYYGWVFSSYLSGRDPKNPQAGDPPAEDTDTDGLFRPGSYQYSQFAVDWSKRFESFQAKAYWDVTGWAIGYGHNGGSGVPPIPKKGDTISKEEAERVLMSDMDLQLHYLEAYVDVPLTQGQIDALILHIFQQGPGNFRRKGLRELVNSGRHAEVVRRLRNWPTSNAGLLRRRRVEAQIYLGEKPTKW